MAKRKKNGRTDLLGIFADDKQLIVYRPEWRKICGGSAIAAILLQQIIYHWDNQKGKPFYKFKKQCDDVKCTEGDSWTEELGFSVKEFDSAIKKIGQKLSKKRLEEHPEIDYHKKPVEYWIDEKHITWYTIHEENLYTLLSTIYDIEKTSESSLPCEEESYSLNDQRAFREMTKGHLGKRPKGIQENDQRAFSILNDQRAFSKMTKGYSDIITKITNKEEITTKTTTETTHPEMPIVVDVVVEKINSLLSYWEEERGVRRTGKRHKGERITDNFLNELCRIHSLLSPREVLNAVSALAPNPSVGSVLAVMKGSKNGNGQYESSCWSSSGECLLGFDASLLQIGNPPQNQEGLNENHEAEGGSEIDWQAEFDALPEETRTAIRTQAETKIATHKSRMTTPEVYEETLKLAAFGVFQEWKRSDTAEATEVK